MQGYEGTIRYWEPVFKGIEDYNPFQEFDVKKLEEGISWVCEGNSSVIDFGCGSGKVLMRCLSYGAKKVLGIDISEEAVTLARRVAEKYQIGEQASFLCGGVSALKGIGENTFDGGILFNIVDNIIPADGHKVLEEFRRIIRPEGKILFKLNPFLHPEKIQEKIDKYNWQVIDDNFYLEDSGLYLWNLPTAEWEKILKPYFKIKEYDEVYFEKHDVTNRLFKLVVKDNIQT